MSDFSPLPINSQSGTDVLFVKTNTLPTELYEAIALRLNTAAELLHAIACMPIKTELNALPVAMAASTLVSDVEGMLLGLYDHLERQEKIQKAGIDCTACLKAAHCGVRHDD